MPYESVQFTGKEDSAVFVQKIGKRWGVDFAISWPDDEPRPRLLQRDGHEIVEPGSWLVRTPSGEVVVQTNAQYRQMMQPRGEAPIR